MSQHGDTRQDPREIAKWAKRYAQSRTIPFLVQWVLIVILVSVVGLLCYMAIEAYRNGRTTTVWACMGGTIATTLALTWFSVAKWGGEQIWRITRWVYGKEGYASYAGREGADSMRLSIWVALAGAGLAVYHMAEFILAGLRHLPMEYIQPLSALYMVPFLVLMIVTQRLGFWAWLWPVLYGLHAVLLLSGAPLHFSGERRILDVIVPIFGYALLSILVGHVYSRYAFRKLKSLAREGLDEDAHDPGSAAE